MMVMVIGVVVMMIMVMSMIVPMRVRMMVLVVLVRHGLAVLAFRSCSEKITSFSHRSLRRPVPRFPNLHKQARR
jgi:hypothetical protein